ncbi:hypothetical protein C0Q70_18444 [Pomacea canaliculata]|uniref:Secreted protein n=1 Tax=Pomacea canaliculata TaxID=400727 RepID=A0A2T7NN89_POMCA|nr:hypothetical protein C0Q70_18444 [Pomacea canaliculata]
MFLVRLGVCCALVLCNKKLCYKNNGKEILHKHSSCPQHVSLASAQMHTQTLPGAEQHTDQNSSSDSNRHFLLNDSARRRSSDDWPDHQHQEDGGNAGQVRSGQVSPMPGPGVGGTIRQQQQTEFSTQSCLEQMRACTASRVRSIL